MILICMYITKQDLLLREMFDVIVNSFLQISKKLQDDIYSFLSRDIPITLFMDNIGGHSKNDVKEQYKKI